MAATSNKMRFQETTIATKENHVKLVFLLKSHLYPITYRRHIDTRTHQYSGTSIFIVKIDTNNFWVVSVNIYCIAMFQTSLFSLIRDKDVTSI